MYGEDPLTEMFRQGALQLLAQAVENEVAGFWAEHAKIQAAQGCQMRVRNGHVPERQIQTGIGEVTVHAPRERIAGRSRRLNASGPPRKFCPARSGGALATYSDDQSD